MCNFTEKQSARQQGEEKKVLVLNRSVMKLKIPNDKLSKQIFEFSADKYAEIIEYGVQCRCLEDKHRKAFVDYWLELIEGYSDKLPPDPFTREVFYHAVSAYEQGYRAITFSMMLDSLTGGVEKRHISKNQYEALRAAFNKLAFTRITIDLMPLLKAFPKYRQRHKKDDAKLIDTLLPCRIWEATVNGQKTLTVEMRDESPLMYVAKLKNQLLTYDATPLAISGQKNTPQVIVLKNYLLRRIELIKRGSLKSNCILFETLYKQCGLADASKSSKQDARKSVADILSSFVADGLIESFEFEREEDGAFRAIKLSLTKSCGKA